MSKNRSKLITDTRFKTKTSDNVKNKWLLNIYPDQLKRPVTYPHVNTFKAVLLIPSKSSSRQQCIWYDLRIAAHCKLRAALQDQHQLLFYYAVSYPNKIDIINWDNPCEKNLEQNILLDMVNPICSGTDCSVFMLGFCSPKLTCRKRVWQLTPGWKGRILHCQFTLWTSMWNPTLGKYQRGQRHDLPLLNSSLLAAVTWDRRNRGSSPGWRAWFNSLPRKGEGSPTA